jgi:predicted ATPase
MIGPAAFLKSIRLKNILSFGAGHPAIDLRSLNVLIGKNAAGKSNMIEALSLLSAAPTDLARPLREGGGVDEWLNKGSGRPPVAEIEVVYNHMPNNRPLRYRIEFTSTGQRFELIDEVLENESKLQEGEQDVYFYYRYQKGNPVLNVIPLDNGDEKGEGEERTRRFLKRESLEPNQSVLSQRKDPDQYPELTFLANQFSRMKFYREWNFGRYTPPRLPQKADLPEDFLMEDAGNLGLVLNDLQHRSETKSAIIQKLSRFHEGVEDLSTKIHGGTVQVFIHEKGPKHPVIPATRMSDGTLRYLCLLAVLCHPTPPCVVCIEEPELGLHPDVLPEIAQMLIDASHRTQLFVTTHSDVLVSELTQVPESVIVCEQGDGGTELKRLKQAELETWLEKYSLGELWRMGEIGGV